LREFPHDTAAPRSYGHVIPSSPRIKHRKEDAMHAQVVTFTLNGITEEEYREACEGEAETFAALPGLLGKIWLRDPETNTYGGIYLWRDRDWFEAYIEGEVFGALKEDASLKGVQSRDFEIFEDLTKATQPHLSLV
jgi:heme-degrading monooxygenase HmoA